MPFVNDAYSKRFSDLVVHEIDPSVGYSRRSINVTPPGSGAKVELGTLVYRAKATTTTGSASVFTASGGTALNADLSGDDDAVTITITVDGVTTAPIVINGANGAASLVIINAALTAANIKAVASLATSQLVVTESAVGGEYRGVDISVGGEDGAAVAGAGVNVKGAAANSDGAYAVFSDVAQLVATNEFAVVYGDHFSFNPSFVPRAVVQGRHNAVGFVGHTGGLQLKEYYIKATAKAAVAALTDNQFELIKKLLELQGIVVLETK